MNRRVTVPAIAVVAGWLLIAALVAVLGWAPPAHEVRTSGAMSIAGVVTATGGDPYYQYAFATLPPNTSLDALRCQAWHQRSPTQPCPDSATLRKDLWPSLAQAPNNLYVAVTDFCPSFNVEYLSWSRSLVVHCYVAQAWVVAYGPPGVEAMPTWMLLVVPTQAMAPGEVTVVLDDRVEHWLGDDSTESVLGKVATA